MAMELYGDEKMHYMLEIDILRIPYFKFFWDFKGLGVQKDTLDSLLAKTMC